METKYCKYCQCEHPITEEWWYFIKQCATQCKKHAKQRRKEQYEQNREQTLRQNREYKEANKEKFATQNKEYVEANMDKILLYRQRYYKDNKTALIKDNVNRSRARYKADVHFRLSCCIRHRLREALKHNYKNSGAVRQLGCTPQELRLYLESKFQPGMTWRNWGVHGWHIDHIIPLSSFDLLDPVQLVRACHYTNLQPLWAEENLKKGAKIELHHS